MKYKLMDLATKLNVSEHTIRCWYSWENSQLKDGSIKERYLPVPQRIPGKGRPRVWDDAQVEQLKEFQKTIVKGRNGTFGAYTNPIHTETRKYKKQISKEELKNGTE